jgi:hypothetical protein
VKVAQYEVLGNDAKDPSVPQAQGTIETLGFWSRTPLSDCHHWSIVPFLLRRPDYGGQAGTDTSKALGGENRCVLSVEDPCRRGVVRHSWSN